MQNNNALDIDDKDDVAELARMDKVIDDAQAALARLPDLDELRLTLCAVGIVGQIDGHDVIRRDSVIDLVDRRRGAAKLGGGHGQVRL